MAAFTALAVPPNRSRSLESDCGFPCLCAIASNWIACRHTPRAPRLRAVPSNVYMKMSASEVMAGNVVCDGLDWVTFEVSRERLRRSLPQDEQADIDNMTPYEVAMMAPSQPCAS